MQITDYKERIKSNFSESKKFTIEASAKAFKTLSDNLYSDKIKAVIRELSTNAYDAHVEIGNSSKPFEIHLPNDLEPVFWVKDFGLGMSEEKIYSLYTTYFCSDKTQSNEMVGAFGLGSKSPFAYKNSFTVESIHDNRKRIYTCFLDEDSVPNITKIFDIESYEHTGLKVSIDVDKSDFYYFRFKAVDVLKYFKTTPTILGDNDIDIQFYKDKKFIVGGNDWFITDEKTGHIDIVQGNVSYKIYIQDIRAEIETILSKNNSDNILHHIKDYLFSYSNCLYIEFDIGKINIAPNRESLSMDKRTKQNIILKINSIINEFKNQIQNYIHDDLSLYEVFKIYCQFKNSKINSHIVNCLKYKNKPLSEVFDFEYMTGNNTNINKNDFDFYYCEPYSNNETKNKVCKNSSYINNLLQGVSFSYNNPTKIFVNDTEKEGSGIYKLKQHMKEYKFHSIVIPEDFIPIFGINGDLNRTSNLDYINKPGRKSSSSNSSNQNLSFKLYKDYTLKSFTNISDYDSLRKASVGKKIYYFYKTYDSIKDNDHDDGNENRRYSMYIFEKILDYAVDHNIISNDILICEVTKYEANRKRFKTFEKFEPLLTYINKEFNNFIIGRKKEYLYYIKSIKMSPYSITYRQRSFISLMDKLLKEGIELPNVIKEKILLYRKWYDSNSSIKSPLNEFDKKIKPYLDNYVGIRIQEWENSVKTIDFDNFEDEVCKQHPIFRIVDISNDNNTVEILKKYLVKG